VRELPRAGLDHRKIHPIGLKARHVNATITTPTASETSSTHLMKVGYLSGAPASGAMHRATRTGPIRTRRSMHAHAPISISTAAIATTRKARRIPPG
jgi:hypothetical protein